MERYCFICGKEKIDQAFGLCHSVNGQLVERPQGDVKRELNYLLAYEERCIDLVGFRNLNSE